MMKKPLTIAFATVILLCTASISGNSQTTTFKGKVYRGDKDHPVADAVILMLDQKKTAKKDTGVEAKTDADGNFVFESLAGGKYMVSIRTWHKTQKLVPCQLLLAKTNDKNSTVAVLQDTY